MKQFPLFLVLCLVMLSACQKDIDLVLPEDGNGGGGTDTTGTGGNTSGALLVRSVSISNGESFTTNYSYTANKKIEVIDMAGISGGIDAGSYRRFYRDAAGRIIRIANKVPPQGGIAIDTSFTYVYYPDATTLQYSYTVQTISIAGFEVTDSVLYTYNNAKQITEQYDYQLSPLFGIVQESKTVYTYDAAGNLATITGYNNITGTMEVVSTFQLQYDTKTNPMGADAQSALINGGSLGASPNNVTQLRFSDVTNGTEQLINISYTYGSNGYPATAVQQDVSNNSVANITFYYQ